MGFEYYYGHDGFSDLEPVIEGSFSGIAGFLAVFVGLVYFLFFAVLIVGYVLQSIGMYTIAKRRGINHPWLCWLPVGDAWILGSISDQYQYVVKGKIRNRRKVLMGLSIASVGALIPMYLIGMLGIVLFAVAGGAGEEAVIGAAVAVILLVYLVIMILVVILAVFRLIALYDLYASCDNDNAVLYLVLSIFLSVTMPFLVFFARKKDLGMPPRKAELPEENTEI